MQAYNFTDKRLHQFCQVIAKVNRTVVPKQEDDSHTNLYFESIEKKVCGRWFQQNDKTYLFALDLVNFCFQLLDDKKELVSQFHIKGKTLIEIEEEIEKGFGLLHLPTEGLMKKLHFEIPSYESIDTICKKPTTTELTTWTAHRSIANEACMLLLGLAQVESEIRIWPHHFDTGVYFEAKNHLGIGFGLAMQDEMAKDSYFYLSANPENYKIQYTNLPNEYFWRWEISDDWTGAILPLKELEGKYYEEKIYLLSGFIKTIYNWMIKQ
jgi:hypothetical protein